MKTFRRYALSAVLAGLLSLGVLSPSLADDSVVSSETTTVSSETQAPATEAQVAPADVPAEVPSEPAPDAAEAITVLEKTEP